MVEHFNNFVLLIVKVRVCVFIIEVVIIGKILIAVVGIVATVCAACVVLVWGKFTAATTMGDGEVGFVAVVVATRVAVALKTVVVLIDSVILIPIVVVLSLGLNGLEGTPCEELL